jgi:hypothetical protein
MVFFTVTCLVRAIAIQATVRSCVTWRRSQSSPTVDAGGVTGDIATRFGRWPPAKALSRFHRTDSIQADTRGYGLSMDHNPSPFNLRCAFCVALSQKERAQQRTVAFFDAVKIAPRPLSESLERLDRRRQLGRMGQSEDAPHRPFNAVDPVVEAAVNGADAEGGALFDDARNIQQLAIA